MTMRPTALLLLTLSAAAGAQDLATAFDSEEVAPGIHVLYGADGKFGGGNMALLVGDDEIVLIDDSMTPLAPLVIERATGIAGRPVDFVINTHVHGDHAGGNAALAETGTVVVAHDNIRKRLIADPSPAGGVGGLPVITFNDGISFHVNGMEARVFHIPTAHTDGDGAIEFRGANVIHTGDLWFHGLVPFIDLDNGGSVDGYIAGQQQIIAMADDATTIIPGHGPVAGKAALERDNAMLIDSRSRVKAMVDRGMSEDAIVAANPLEIHHDDYNWGFITTERMTRTLIRDLAGE